MKPGITGGGELFRYAQCLCGAGWRWLNSMDIQEQRRVVILGDRKTTLRC